MPGGVTPLLASLTGPVQACRQASQEAGQVVLRILLADAVMGAVAKHEEVSGKLDVLVPLGSEAVGVKLVGVLVALQVWVGG